MGKKRMEQEATFSKTNEVHFSALQGHINRLGVQKCIHLKTTTYDDGSIAYTVQIHLNPEK